MRRINYQVNGIFIKWNLKNPCLTVSLATFPFRQLGNFLQSPSPSPQLPPPSIAFEAQKHEYDKQKEQTKQSSAAATSSR